MGGLISRRIRPLPRASPSDAETVFVSVQDFHERGPLFAAPAVLFDVRILAEDFGFPQFSQHTGESDVGYGEVGSGEERLIFQPSSVGRNRPRISTCQGRRAFM